MRFARTITPLFIFGLILLGLTATACAMFDLPDSTSEQPGVQSRSATETENADVESTDTAERTPWLREYFPETMHRSVFLLPHFQWVCLFVVILLGVVADRLTRFMLNWITFTWLKKAGIKIDEKLERGVWKPVGLLVMAILWYAGMHLLGLPLAVLAVLEVAVKLFTVVAGVWTAFLAIDLLSSFLARKALGTRTKFDDLLVPLVSRSLKIFVVAMGLISLAQAFDLPLAGLLSGLGVGGVAIAFAAKDTIANLFGSLTVLLDRPFEIGDWIVTGDIEGSVESVGMRSTRVRTFYNSLINVPNNNLTTAVIDNMGRRRYRRIKTMLGLQYDTSPEQVEAFCEGVRELIRRHAYTRKDYYHVYLNQFSASSLDVLLYCFLECPDWSIELREKQRLFLDIIRLADRLGVSFAFPTQTLHLHQADPAAADPHGGMKEPINEGRRAAAGIVGKLLGRGERPGAVEFTGPNDVK